MAVSTITYPTDADAQKIAMNNGNNAKAYFSMRPEPGQRLIYILAQLKAGTTAADYKAIEKALNDTGKAQDAEIIVDTLEIPMLKDGLKYRYGIYGEIDVRMDGAAEVAPK